MAKNDEADRTPLSGDAARAGVTGHNVRRVLVLGLLGVIAAFAAVAVYFGYDRLAQGLSQFFGDPFALIRNNAAYAFVIVLAAIVAVALLGVWNRVAGKSESTSQTGMRLRVVLQFVNFCTLGIQIDVGKDNRHGSGAFAKVHLSRAF
jgi:hypothetical protein